MKKKRAFTLLEIMIVIFLIGLIGSIVSYNIKGNMEKGKIFKTQQSMQRLQDILELELAKGETTAAEIASNVQGVLEGSGMVKNSDALLKDGWGDKFIISVDDDNHVNVESDRLNRHQEQRAQKSEQT